MSPTRRITAAKSDVDVRTAPGSPGLCALCRTEPECRYQRSPLWSPLYCEGFQPRNSRPPGRQVPKIAQARSKMQRKENPGKYRGLCLLCEIRDACRYPKPEEGVWQCEEYK